MCLDIQYAVYDMYIHIPCRQTALNPKLLNNSATLNALLHVATNIILDCP